MLARSLAIAGLLGTLLLGATYLNISQRSSQPNTDGGVTLAYRGWPHFYAVEIEDANGTHDGEVAKLREQIEVFVLDDQWPIGTWSVMWLIVDWLFLSAVCLIGVVAMVVALNTRREPNRSAA